jgi:hypothetical protein
MRFHDLPAEVEPDAGPAADAVGRLARELDAEEAVEDAVAKFRRDAGPGIRHGKTQEAGSRRSSILPG